MFFPPDYLHAVYMEEKAAKNRLARERKAAADAAATPSSTASSTPITTRPSTPATSTTAQTSQGPITNGLFGSIYHGLTRVAAFDNDKQLEVKFGLKSASSSTASSPTYEKTEAEALKAAQRKRDMDIVSSHEQETRQWLIVQQCTQRPW